MTDSTNKRSYLEKMYPKGTILELTEDLDDKFTPKPAGSRFKVSSADDSGQLHGTWLPPQSGSMAIVVGVDKFRIVS